MKTITELSTRPSFSVAELTRAVEATPDQKDQAELASLLREVQELCGNLFSPDTMIVRSDAFGQHFAADVVLWAEEEGGYSIGKELMDAEAAYLDWLLPNCAELQIAGVVFYMNHKCYLPEDWFFRRSAWQ